MPFDLQRHNAGKRRAPSACFIAIFLFSYVCRWHCLRLCRVPVYLILGSIRKRRRSRQNRGEIWAKTWTFPDISMGPKTAFPLCLPRFVNVQDKRQEFLYKLLPIPRASIHAGSKGARQFEGETRANCLPNHSFLSFDHSQVEVGQQTIIVLKPACINSRDHRRIRMPHLLGHIHQIFSA